jgi:hypothetical protein
VLARPRVLNVSYAAAEITVTAEQGANMPPESLFRLNNEQSVFISTSEFSDCTETDNLYHFDSVCVAFLSGALPGLRSLRRN